MRQRQKRVRGAVDDSADLGAVIGAGRPDTDAGQIRPPTTAVFAGGGGGGLPVTAACAAGLPPPPGSKSSDVHCTFFSGESESQNQSSLATVVV